MSETNEEGQRPKRKTPNHDLIATLRTDLAATRTDREIARMELEREKDRASKLLLTAWMLAAALVLLGAGFAIRTVMAAQLLTGAEAAVFCENGNYTGRRYQVDEMDRYSLTVDPGRPSGRAHPHVTIAAPLAGKEGWHSWMIIRSAPTPNCIIA